MQKIIAIDLDETLAELVEGSLAFHNFQIKGIPLTKNDIEDYYIHNIKKLWLTKQDTDEWFYSFIYSDAMHDIKIIPWAKEKLEEFKNKGYQLYILTARIDKITDLTKKRIDKNIPGIFSQTNIIFANYHTEKARPKREICKEIGANIMIEDNLQFAEELASKGITTYLLKKPRNKQYKNTNPLIISVNWRDEIHL